MIENLEIGFGLKDRWHLMKGTPAEDTRADLIALARILGEAKTPYAIIGGVALEFHSDDPRGTKDIDLAVESYDGLPRERLRESGFRLEDRLPYMENWRAPGRTPIQFADEPFFREMIRRATEDMLDGVRIRILAKPDMLRAKLAAARATERRASRRLQDIADANALVECDPGLVNYLTEREREILELPR
jgi:hypothetical protein